MTINIEVVLERAYEQVFRKPLEQTVQVKAEELFSEGPDAKLAVVAEAPAGNGAGFPAFSGRRDSLGKEEAGIQEMNGRR
jgi:hypothetical protein